MKSRTAILSEIAAERGRQVADEGYSPAHDDAHTHAELARAAGAFVLLAAASSATRPHEIRKAAVNLWPFEDGELREKRSARRMLVIAGALIIAEIERLDRRPNIDRLLSEATAAFAALSPEQQEAELAAQRQSFVRGQLGMGDDAQEAADRAALHKHEEGMNREPGTRP